MFGQCIGVSQSVDSALCYCILSEKGEVLSYTTCQHLTADKPIYLKIQECIYDYHSFLEAALGSSDFVTSLYACYYFINDDE